jgi:hypothetical protein
MPAASVPLCQVQVRMKQAGDFRCTLKLRKEFDDHSLERLSSVDEKQFGEPLDKTELVELGIRRAQKALLNPSTNFEDFLR